MLELGFPAETRADPDSATALHAAPRSGGGDVVQILIDARDSVRNATPLC